MASIFITGSADGLGQLAAKMLVEQGRPVVLHPRNAQRGRQAKQNVPGAEHVIISNLSDGEETKHVAEAANAWGRFDAVIHNAGVYQAPAKEIYAVNVIAPYLLTCLMQRPERLIYLSSDLHLSGRANLDAFQRGFGRASYSDSKLYVVMLCMAAARASGRCLYPTPSIRAGCPRKWVSPARRTICSRAMRHKLGWRSATTGEPKSADGIFIIA